MSSSKTLEEFVRTNASLLRSKGMQVKWLQTLQFALTDQETRQSRSPVPSEIERTPSEDESIPVTDFQHDASVDEAEQDSFFSH